MKKSIEMIKTFLADDEGVTAIEYGLIAALVALSLVGGATLLGTGLNDIFTDIGTYLSAKPAP